eukprot:maker-scaffold548_size139981-snap-gene-0.23 protein:Tk08553 transcript:maker-scaffold548_size139981-snap-gene-0.23-mRNA-1 annotation:"low quality protein: p-selectin"
MGCPNLHDLPQKNLLLAHHHQYFLEGTTAGFQCRAGYALNGSAALNVTCLSTLAWNVDVNLTMPSCVPITCPTPSQPTFGMGWNVTHRLFYGQDPTLLSTWFETSCPDGLTFANSNNQTRFEAKCTAQDVWTVTSDLGCQIPTNVTSETDGPRFQCPELALGSLDCQVPACSQELGEAFAIEDDGDSEVVAKDLVFKDPGSQGVIKCKKSVHTFRSHANSSLSLANITGTCVYASNGTSNWTIFDQGIKVNEVLGCHSYCSTNPPMAGSFMAKDWDTSRWDDTNVTYTCQEGYSFDLPDVNLSSVALVAKCEANEAETANEWAIYWEAELLPKLPKCVAKCSVEPPKDDALFNRTWDKNMTVGAKAHYTCLSNPLQSQLDNT